MTISFYTDWRLRSDKRQRLLRQRDQTETETSPLHSVSVSNLYLCLWFLRWAHSRRTETRPSTVKIPEDRQDAGYGCERKMYTRPTATLSMMAWPEAPIAKSGILSPFTSPGETTE